MNKKEVMNKIQNLSEELGYIEIPKNFIKKGESKYLVDYLYGVSDIERKALDILFKNSLDSDWILIHRVLVKREEFEKSKFYEFEELNKNIFLARNEHDLTRFLDHIQKKYSVDIEKEYEDIVDKIKDKFLKNKDGDYKDVFLYKAEEKRKKDNKLQEFKNVFDNLLRRYLIALKNKNIKEEEESIYKLDVHLKNSGRRIIKTDFFNDILGINKTRISEIQKKFNGGK